MAITFRTRNPDLRNRAFRAIKAIEVVVKNADRYEPAERCEITRKEWSRLAPIAARRVAERAHDKTLAAGLALAEQAYRQCQAVGLGQPPKRRRRRK